MATSRSNPAIGALALIVICFFGSAALRLSQNGAAYAEGFNSATAPDDTQPKEQASRIPAEKADKLLSAIREREKQLAEDASRLADRAQALSIAEKKLSEQLLAFETAQNNLEETLATADQAAERDINQMTAVYESMKPDQAARIIERMEITFAAGLLARMRPELTADVLTNMEPDTAYAVTLTIASRNSGVPTD